MTEPAAGPLRRIAAVLVTGSVGAAAPPGVDPASFGRALVEDTTDVVAGLEMVLPAVAVTDAGEKALGGRVDDLVWPGTQIIRLGRGTGAGAATARTRAGAGAPATGAGAGPAKGTAAPAAAGPGSAVQALNALSGLGASQGAVLTADAPDLPPLLIGKLFRALGSQRQGQIAVCPADGGGLVALAGWLPAPRWLAGLAPGAGVGELDLDDIAERLRGAAPGRSAVRSGPGWHRLRSAADVSRLDRGLEGWEATRDLLLARHPRH